jgi:WD40 repeat protein
MRLLLTYAFAVLIASAQNYVRDVYPIWEKHCLGCHASGTKMGSLDIETWEGIQRGGNHGTILVPGDIKASRLYTMLVGETKPAMPMDGQVLSAGEIEVVRKWIASGATPPTANEIAMLRKKAAGEDPVPVSAKPKSKPQIFSLAWRPGSAEVAVGRFQTVDLLDGTSKQVRATFEGHAEVVRALAFTKDGKRLAAAGGRPGRQGEVIIWNAESKAVISKLNGHQDAIYAVAFSPDGKLLATASYDKLIKLWDPETGREISTLKDHIDAIYALAFTPDGQRLISGAADRTIKIWNPASGERIYTLSDPTDGINAIALSPDGKRVAAAGFDKNIRIWELGEKAGTLIQSAIAHEDAIIALAWSPDGTRIVSSCADKTLKIFNATDLAELKALPGQSDWVYGLAFSGDSAKIAVGRFDGSYALLER